MPPKRGRSPNTASPARKSKKTINPDKGKSVPKAGPSTPAICFGDLLTDKGWKDHLAPCLATDNMTSLGVWLAAEYSNSQVFPPKSLIFNAFNLTPFKKVKVVIIGQDPYHDDGQAHGLSFSVPRGIGVPPSLKNIYKELATDIPGFTIPDHGSLEAWASRGVLLLNATLTVRAHEANSHAKSGWMKFTDDVIRVISDKHDPCVFLLWGNFAQKKEKLIDVTKHKVIKTAHPSPLSFTKFKGCKCFSKVNDELEELSLEKLDWNVPA